MSENTRGQSVAGDPVPAAPLTLADRLEDRKGLYRQGRSIPFTHVSLDEIIAALRQSGAGRDRIKEFEQIVMDESAQWKGVGDDTHGAQTACQMILQKIAALKEHT